MQIRPWVEADRQFVTDLVAILMRQDPPLSSEDAVHGSDRDSLHAFQRTLVAVDQGAIVGLGTLWENWLHPARWRVTLHGHPSFWSRDPASALLAQLRRLRPDARLLQAATAADDGAACEFFRQHGFAPLMRTRRGVLAPGAVPEPVAAEFNSAMVRVESARFHVASLSEVGSDRVSVADLARLHAKLYRHGHRWDPARSLTDEEAVELFLDPDELLPEATYLAFAGEHPVAVASLRRSGVSCQADLGWVGALPSEAPRAGDLIVALVGRCLHHAAAAAWHVSFEVDESDSHLWQLLDQLLAAREPDWLTFSEVPCLSRGEQVP